MDKRNKLKGWIISAVLLLPIIASAQKYRSNWEKGNKAYEEGNYPLAQKHYSEALADRPEAAEQYFNLGDALFKQDKPNEAIEAYRKSLEAFSDPADQAKALHNIGNAHMKLKQFQQAVEAYKDALRRDPGDEETRYNLAKAMKMLRDEQKQQKQDQQNNSQEQQQNQDQQNNEDQSQKDSDKQDQKDQKGDQQEQKDPQDQNSEGENNENGEKKDQNENSDQKEGEQKDQNESPSDGTKPGKAGEEMKNGTIDRREAEKLLEMLGKMEAKTLDKVENRKKKGATNSTEKDW